jgi:predicted 2-oxoglutarate/Fe(II)-dependent dioxygenase YbiX/peroxiredoxin
MVMQQQRESATSIPKPSVGEPAPWFSAATGSNTRETLAFDELAGRYILLFFFGTAARPEVAAVLAALGRRPDLLDHKRALLLGISNDRDDFAKARLRQNDAGHLFLWDSNGFAAEQYGAAERGPAQIPAAVRPVAFILSPALQIIEIIPLTEPSAFVRRVESRLTALLAEPVAVQNAPVLVVPQVFDRAFCCRLVALYESNGGREIGLIENQGKIVERSDPKFRKRFDYYISDDQTLQEARALLARRLLPMVYRAFQFGTTRIERYLVGCYDATIGGYFRPHRDNTAPMVAHRRFAVTINLNEGYDGGDLCFPEFHQTYRTAPGDAIVFSCSLLHEVTPVTLNRRYAFLSFLYDEQSQRIREAYSKKLS